MLRSRAVVRAVWPACFALKRAMVLCDSGKGKECREELSQVPEELLDPHSRRIKRELEGRS